MHCDVPLKCAISYARNRHCSYLLFCLLFCVLSWILFYIAFPSSFLSDTSVRRSNCYMVCVGDVLRGSSSSRSNVDLEIGCYIDLASGFVTFTANGKELPISYQVRTTIGPIFKQILAITIYITHVTTLLFDL